MCCFRQWWGGAASSPTCLLSVEGESLPGKEQRLGPPAGLPEVTLSDSRGLPRARGRRGWGPQANAPLLSGASAVPPWLVPGEHAAEGSTCRGGAPGLVAQSCASETRASWVSVTFLPMGAILLAGQVCRG